MAQIKDQDGVEPEKPVQTDNRERKEDPKQTVSQDPEVDYSQLEDE